MLVKYGGRGGGGGDDDDDDIDEDMKLTRKDYHHIIRNYSDGSTTSRNKKKMSLKKRAHQILAQKLCRCIRPLKTGTQRASRRIAYCTQSIFNNKGLRVHGFHCTTKTGKNRPRLTRDITKIAE
jgi:hypothetical protein